MVKLYNSAETVKEYYLTFSTFNIWIKRINSTGSAKEANNRYSEEIELIKIRKENQQLRRENDILKQV